MKVYTFFLLVYTCFLSNQITQSEGAAVNVALNKPISADVTCGKFGSELYFPTSQIYVEPLARIKYYCLDETIHPPRAMVDGIEDTLWQSTSRFNIYDNNLGDLETNREAIINVDLEQEFHLESLQFKMAESKRPGSIEVLKSLDGVNYIPWLYKVSMDANCDSEFGLPTLDKPVSDASILCTSYDVSVAANVNETILIDLSTFTDYYDFSQARYLRINFYKMELVLGAHGNSFQHFTVRELIVMAECSCFGHHTDCVKNNVSEKFECVCGHNTQGKYCEQCLPFFNQQAHTHGEPCQACFCYGHSDQCYYNSTIAQFNMSLNAAGVKEGGGVCLNCLNNTAGVNCEKCEDYYFRPGGRPQDQEDACVSCDCHPDGVTVHLETGLLGDCVMNEDVTAGLGMAPGDCFCKANVAGSKCDQCKAGFYNLRNFDFQGCQDCVCDVSGTEDGSPVCVSDETGQCPCKLHVTGRQCNICKDLYFGLDANKTTGCDPCNCDVGGTSAAGCNKVSGACTCRLYVTGRQCDSPREGYYYPDLHFINSEMEDREGVFGQSAQYPGFLGFGYAIIQENATVSTYLIIPPRVPASRQFYLLIRYRADQGGAGEVTVAGQVNSTSVTLAQCNGWCVVVVGDSKLYDLFPGQYMVSLTVNRQVFVDRIVAIPEEFLNPTVLEREKDTFSNQCSVLANNMNLGTPSEQYCLSKVFSVTTYYLDGALPCDCDFVGSNSTVCNPYGGQCSCKPGVGGRKCDKCSSGFYQMTVGGCQPCDCAGIHKICHPQSGSCICPPNTIGRRCDQCQINTFNWLETEGCTPCGCHDVGSGTLQCNGTTGTCQCKRGVTGEKCDTCEDGFEGLGFLGCDSCNCDMRGSNDSVCNKATGQCPCKENTAGVLCNQCAAGAYNLDSSHPKGCLDCVCMGITTDCDSSDLTLLQQTFPLIQAAAVNGDFVPMLSLVTASDTDAGLNLTAGRDSFTGDFIEASVDGSEALFWKYAEESQSSSLGLYGSSVEFDVSIDVTSGNSVLPRAYIVLGNSQRLSFALFSAVLQNTTTRLSLPVKEYDWTNESGDRVTRGEFLLALLDIRSWLFPATFFSSPHVTRVSNFRFTVGVPGNVGGDRAVRLEQCQCGPAYVGLSCESCAPGYKRANVTEQGYLGVCVPCECNGHSDLCDSDTGECLDCQHNTQGFNCESCQIGYFGDGFTVCSQCPCFEPRVSNKSCEDVNGTVECLQCNAGYVGAKCDKCELFHFGQPELLNKGTCTPCDCKGNSQSCDTTFGDCIDCGSNTTGSNCERCIVGFYGNASLQNCQPCECDMNGSNNTICDHLTGQCPCHPGVGERTCNQCQQNYWGYNDQSVLGCVPCDCNVEGSSTLQCDDQSGICVCKSDASGVKCDRCAEGFWGLPHRACSECGCDAIGSVNVSQPCDSEFGQCECKTGVAGRQCDTCERLYNGFGPDGCQACGDCQYSLGNDTALLQNQWRQEYWTKAIDVGAIQEQDRILQGIDRDLNQTLTELGLSELTLGYLTGLVDNLTNEEPGHSQSVSSLQTSLDNQLSSSATLHNNTLDELNRQNDLQTQSQAAASAVDSGLIEGRVYVRELIVFNDSAANLLNDGVVVSGSINVSFSADLQVVQLEEAALLNTTTDAEAMRSQVDYQEAETTELEGRAEALNIEADTIQQRTASVQLTLGGVRMVEQAAEQAINDTLYHMTRISSLDNETVSMLSLASAMWTESRDKYQVAGQTEEDCLVILDNPDNQLPLPINTSVDLTGFSSWTSAAASLEEGLSNTLQNIQTIGASVTAATVQATQLSANSALLLGEFNSVLPLGQAAVEAVQNYERVMASLNTSLTQADEADKAIQSAQATLATVTLATLESEARTSKEQSDSLLGDVNSRNYQSDVLDSQLQSANVSLQNAIRDWVTVDGLLATVQTEADTIQPIATGTEINALMTQANSLSDSAKSTADMIVNNNKALLTTLNTLSGESVVVQSQSENASSVVTSLDNSIRSYEDSLRTVLTDVESMNRSYTQASLTRTSLDVRLANLELNVQRARELAKQLKQPVKFNQNNMATISNPDVVTEKLCNKVSLEYKAPAKSNSLLFFVENNATGATFALELDNGFVVFRFAINLERVWMTNPAEVGEDQWARVEASRCGNTGQVSVTLLSTGATAIVYKAGVASKVRTMMLASPLYIGGLPNGYETTKVANTKYEGCLYKVKYEDQELSLWEQQVVNGEAQCCRKPVYFTDVRLDPGTTFTGFGYLQLPAGTLNVSVNSHLVFKFRTFSPNSVLFLIDTQITDLYYGLFMVGGKIIFDYGSPANIRRLESTLTYNSGDWFMVSTFHNSTYQELLLHYNVNGTFFERERLPNILPALDLSPLAGAPITFGSQNPNTFRNRGLVLQEKFAGSILDFLHSTPTDASLTARSLERDVSSELGILHNQVIPEVISGLTLSSESSYAKLSVNQLRSTSSISIYFASNDPNGILAYTTDSFRTDALVYVALSHGNVVMYYNDVNGNPLKGPVKTTGLYLSDGVLHHVQVNFKTSFRADLTVDDLVIEDSQNSLTFPTISINGGHLYLGGVPGTVALDQTLPVTNSLVGGIQQAQVNGGNINFFAPGLIVDHSQVSLDGMAKPRPFPLPPPYTIPDNQPPAPTSCMSPSAAQYSNEGVRFGTGPVSFRKYQLSSEEINSLTGSFVLTIQFRSFASNGILFYMADRLTDPVNWFSVYLEKGAVVLSMKTNTGNPATYRLSSTEVYNTGTWWEVDTLRINDFMAVVVKDVKDYKNNNIDPVTPSFLTLGTPVYIGGLDLLVTGDLTGPLPIGKTPFIGCIRKVEITTSREDIPKFGLNLQNPMDSAQTGACYSNVEPGVRLSGQSAYITAESAYSYVYPFEFSVNITTTSRSANILTIWQLKSKFIVLDIYQGQIRCMLGNDKVGEEDYPFIAVSNYPANGYTICDNKPHSIYLRIEALQLTLKIGESAVQVFPFPTGFLPANIASVPLYVGGVPSAEKSRLLFPEPVSLNSFNGCLNGITINSRIYDPQTVPAKGGVSFGCFM